MNNPLGVSPSKGIREPHEVKKQSFDLGRNRTHDLRIRSTVTLIRRSWVRFLPRSKDCFFTSCGSLIPLLGLTPRGLFMGSISTLIYTSELTLCFTISKGRASAIFSAFIDVGFLAIIKRWLSNKQSSVKRNEQRMKTFLSERHATNRNKAQKPLNLVVRVT